MRSPLAAAPGMVSDNGVRAELKDMYLRDQRKRNDGLEDTIADYQNTIDQFRDLVLSLQRSAQFVCFR